MGLTQFLVHFPTFASHVLIINLDVSLLIVLFHDNGSNVVECFVHVFIIPGLSDCVKQKNGGAGDGPHSLILGLPDKRQSHSVRVAMRQSSSTVSTTSWAVRMRPHQKHFLVVLLYHPYQSTGKASPCRHLWLDCQG